MSKIVKRKSLFIFWIILLLADTFPAYSDTLKCASVVLSGGKGIPCGENRFSHPMC
jgi:hypothetical protein